LEHRLVGVLPVTALASAGEYARHAQAEIDGALDAGRRPIVVGGTGLYLRAALADLDLRPPPAPGIREHWTARLAAEGPAALHARLATRDPAAAAAVAPTDGRRIVRALELLDSGATPPPERAEQLWTTEMRHPTLLVALVMERAALYARIDERVDAMIAAGAEEEVRRAEAAGASGVDWIVPMPAPDTRPFRLMVCRSRVSKLPRTRLTTLMASCATCGSIDCRKRLPRSYSSEHALAARIARIARTGRCTAAISRQPLASALKTRIAALPCT